MKYEHKAVEVSGGATLDHARVLNQVMAQYSDWTLVTVVGEVKTTTCRYMLFFSRPKK